MSRLADLGPEFDDFVREASSGLLRMSFLLTGDRGQAEDLLQVSLVRTATHWAAARSNPAIFARRVLVNLAKNRWRDLARRLRVARYLAWAAESSSRRDTNPPPQGEPHLTWSRSSRTSYVDGPSDFPWRLDDRRRCVAAWSVITWSGAWRSMDVVRGRPRAPADLA